MSCKSMAQSTGVSSAGCEDSVLIRLTSAGRWVVGGRLMLVRRLMAVWLGGCCGLLQPAFACPVQVLTEDLPPYQLVEQGELVGGRSYIQVQQVLLKAGWSCQSTVLPWARAYTLALQQSDTLIYSLVRTKEREALFHWILPLGVVDYRFYSADAALVRQLHPADASRYSAVAVSGSIEASLLQQQGFVVEQNLVLVKDYNAVWHMLLKGRAQLTLASTPNYRDSDVAALRQAVFYSSSRVASELGLYLAASRRFDTAILSKLRAAAEQQQLAPIARK